MHRIIIRVMFKQCPTVPQSTQYIQEHFIRLSTQIFDKVPCVRRLQKTFMKVLTQGPRQRLGKPVQRRASLHQTLLIQIEIPVVSRHSSICKFFRDSFPPFKLPCNTLLHGGLKKRIQGGQWSAFWTIACSRWTFCTKDFII